MTNYAELSRKPSEFNAITGMPIDEFNSLLFCFERAESESKFTIEGKERERKYAVYKNSPINCSADRLLSVLIYTKQYTTQLLLGLLFGIGQAKANRLIHYLSPILSSALRESGSSPCRNMEELDNVQSWTYIHNGTERTINRPKDIERQKDHYSGRKKTCTVKNCTVSNSACAVIFLTSTACGKKT